MADRPIIFSGPMVRALLEGRKTQTRRALKLAGRAPDFIGPRGCEADPRCWGWETPDGYFVTVEGDEKDHAPGWRNGWRDWAGAYAPGDRLWVREAHAMVPYTAYLHSDGVQMTAHGGTYEAAIYREGFDRCRSGIRWRPSIHMPRWASRLTLTVTDVRVQRLQDISEADAVAEGWPGPMTDIGYPISTPRQWFSGLWNRLHRHDAWDANPWVVAISFQCTKQNIDQITGGS